MATALADRVRDGRDLMDRVPSVSLMSDAFVRVMDVPKGVIYICVAPPQRYDVLIGTAQRTGEEAV
jgi:hypothetical protein